VKWESVTFCQPFVKALLKTCFSGLKSSRWVGDFQVATGGGFWVATRDWQQNEKEDTRLFVETSDFVKNYQTG
ncbi:MAG: hypothetical protein Q8O28_13530, partial [Smithellaceae bacterium]|nr:hypothetical protein [Smithellaceae bacterium]